MPYSLSIPKIAKTADIIPVGITSDNKMDMPHNYVQVGWYEYSAMPGQIGSSILDGHVDNGAAIPGVFKRLHELSVGDDIYVTERFGSMLHFKVTDMTVYDRASSSVPVLAGHGISLLKIITCHGKFISKDRTYNERLVVTAELVS